MISGVHAILYSKDADRLRSFFRDVLGFPAVDAGHGWLIFALPPGEMGVHPTGDGEEARHELYLMCDNVEATIASLAARGVSCTPVVDEGWGLATSVSLPDGGTIGLYQPRHPSPLKPSAPG
jgi:catechol 2,3-dioxygenase-like lactoylglutathione lyase family enzyme